MEDSNRRQHYEPQGYAVNFNGLSMKSSLCNGSSMDGDISAGR